MKVGINGMGRMGRLALRAALGGVVRDAADPRADNRLDIVHVNEIKGGAAAAAHLLEFDSVHGRWRTAIGHGRTAIDGSRIRWHEAGAVHRRSMGQGGGDHPAWMVGTWKSYTSNSETTYTIYPNGTWSNFREAGYTGQDRKDRRDSWIVRLSSEVQRSPPVVVTRPGIESRSQEPAHFLRVPVERRVMQRSAPRSIDARSLRTPWLLRCHVGHRVRLTCCRSAASGGCEVYRTGDPDPLRRSSAAAAG